MISAEETDNYEAAEPKEITVTVSKAAQTITASNLSLTYLKTGTITVSGNKGELSYTSSNTDIATVDSTGKVTAKGIGTATIMISAKQETDNMKLPNAKGDYSNRFQGSSNHNGLKSVPDIPEQWKDYSFREPGKPFL